mmetsp:Transcript_20851/g.34402  ORF Transcript_20851/g.34402 Transcript_20851/m.34402 type:complete len:609 (+) Transcript_20851:154-1980(+)
MWANNLLLATFIVGYAACFSSRSLTLIQPRSISSLTVQTLQIRGGSNDEEQSENINSTASIADGSDDDEDSSNSENEMQSLRKQWSISTPAVPSIEWPFRDTILRQGDALPDFDDSTNTHRTSSPEQHTKTKAMILMDGFCPYHGQYIAKAAHHIYGAAVIHVLSDFCTRYLYQVEKQTEHLSSRIPDLSNGNEVEAWMSLLPTSLDICGLYCESDSGLEDAEKLGVALGLYPRCHDGVNVARRDKFAMNDVVSKAGLDVVKQKSCQTVEEAEEFAKELGLNDDASESTDGNISNTPLVVVKPHRGVASDDVHLCSNMKALREAFAKIHSSPVFGSATAAKHQSVLIQEFARGTEYAIDVVCRDGERKVAALWKYDKRPMNGAPFVYFATQLIPAASNDGEESKKDVEEAVCNYVFNALEALDIRWGLSHVEVIVTRDSKTGSIQVRLVEVNCRQHNTDFMPLTNACVGYNALDMVLAAYLGKSDESSSSHDYDYPEETAHLRLSWESLPILPTTRAHGAIIHFVSHVSGRISRINYEVFDQMEELPSVMDMHVYPQFLDEGNEIEKTVDIRSDTGWAHVMNDDEEEFQRDIARLIELQKEMFDVEEG